MQAGEQPMVPGGPPSGKHRQRRLTQLQVATEAEGLCLTLGGSGGVVCDCEAAPPVGT